MIERPRRLPLSLVPPSPHRLYTTGLHQPPPPVARLVCSTDFAAVYFLSAAETKRRNYATRYFLSFTSEKRPNLFLMTASSSSDDYHLSPSLPYLRWKYQSFFGPGIYSRQLITFNCRAFNLLRFLGMDHVYSKGLCRDFDGTGIARFQV